MKHISKTNVTFPKEKNNSPLFEESKNEIKINYDTWTRLEKEYSIYLLG